MFRNVLNEKCSESYGFGLVFYDMKQHTIVPYRSHPVLKNMGYTSTVNDIIYRKRTNELCFATWDDGVWFYNVKAGKAHVINTPERVPNHRFPFESSNKE